MPDLIGRRFAPAASDVACCGESPMSPRVKDGCTSRRCSISVHVASSATRSPNTCAPSSSPTRSRWPPPLAVVGLAGSSSMVTATANHVERLPPADRRSRHGPVRRSHRGVLGQRGRRVVLVIAQTRSRAPLPVAARADARRAIFAWLNRYNQQRLHSSLGYLPPIEWEQPCCQAQANQAAQPTRPANGEKLTSAQVTDLGLARSGGLLSWREHAVPWSETGRSHGAGVRSKSTSTRVIDSR